MKQDENLQLQIDECPKRQIKLKVWFTIWIEMRGMNTGESSCGGEKGKNITLWVIVWLMINTLVEKLKKGYKELLIGGFRDSGSTLVKP